MSAVVKALKTSVSFNSRAGQYVTKIGYHFSEANVRARSYWYLGGNQGLAGQAALKKAEEWIEMKRTWLSRWPTIKTMDAKYKEDEPVWIDKERIDAALDASYEQGQEWFRAEKGKLIEQVGRTLALMEQLKPTEGWTDADSHSLQAILSQHPDLLRNLIVQNNGQVSQIKPMTIAQAKEAFLSSYKDRLNKSGKFGRGVPSYNNLVATLGISLSPEAIDTTKPLSSVNKADIQTFVAYWLGLPGGISARTAENYVFAVRQMLNHFDSDESSGFTWPKGGKELIREAKAASSGNEKITPYDPAVLKLIVKAATDRVRLYIYLGLLGLYQEDIANLTPDQLRTENDEPHLYWQRQKTQHQNSFHVLTYLWPEVTTLLAKQRAPQNRHNRLLLNEDGLPLTSDTVGKCRTNNISTAVRRACDKAQKPLRFKDLRKFGATAMERLATSDVQRMYRGQASEGSARDYVIPAFIQKLTPALKQWREELIADGILY